MVAPYLSINFSISSAEPEVNGLSLCSVVKKMKEQQSAGSQNFQSSKVKQGTYLWLLQDRRLMVFSKYLQMNISWYSDAKIYTDVPTGLCLSRRAIKSIHILQRLTSGQHTSGDRKTSKKNTDAVKLATPFASAAFLARWGETPQPANQEAQVWLLSLRIVGMEPAPILTG